MSHAKSQTETFAATQRKRRTHYKASKVTLSKDSTTGELHVRHRAHVSEGKLFYKGKVVVEKSPV